MGPKRQREGSPEPEDDAYRALQIGRELEEDDDKESARRCIEYAVERARASGRRQRFDETDRSHISAVAPPPGLVIASGLATLGKIARAADDLDTARHELRGSLEAWAANATALCSLADLELHHGSFEDAVRLYEAAVAVPPCATPPTSRPSLRLRP